jgi:two-component system, NarL family, nitrate/nitrite response regulator NarL
VASERTGHKPIRVLVVAGHAIVRAGLRTLIETHEGLTVIGETATNVEAVCLTEREQPDIVLLDAEPGESGLDLLPELLAANKAARVIILTDLQDPELQQRALHLGASGVVFAGKTPEVLFKAIEKVNAGEIWFERATMTTALGETPRANGVKEIDIETTRIATLTQRELEVVALIGEGLKNKQIAERLFLSGTTVQHYLSSIFAKLGVTDRLELVIYAYQQGLVKLPRQSNEKG